MEIYSIWLMPDDKTIYRKFENIVSKLSEDFGGPIFDPHITLMADVEMDKSKFLEKVELLSKQIKPFKLETMDTSFSTTYFQSVFVFVKATADLMNARLCADEVFGRENSMFMPHISLLYGDFDMQTREKAMKSIEMPRLSYAVDSLVVTPAAGDPKNWYHIAKYNLS